MRAELSAIKPFLITWAVAFLFSSLIVVHFLLNYVAQGKVTDFKFSNQSFAAASSQPQFAKVTTTAVQKPLPPKSAPVSPQPNNQTEANTYARGNCTWYAKSRRPDLPNNLGNAYTWISRARSQGMPTGKEAKVGAIGQSGNHVVYVEKLNPDSTIFISEMNYTSYGKITQRTLPASSFMYIY
ncbi:MAG: amidase [Candidatus Saccharibacteria bacterium]|nr:amidase [Candidatus Saccharibacteria bacterium]